MLRHYYLEGLDHTQLPEFERLTEEQQKFVYDTFANAYASSVKHLGQNIALGKAYETAKRLVQEIASRPAATVPEAPVPPSIFAGLDNC